MKVAVTEGKGDIRLVDVPVPEPGPYQCLCQNLACATCTGTDLKIIYHKMFWAQKEYPAIVGHESIGRVIKTGTKVRNIREGDVFLRPTAAYFGEKLGDYHSLLGGFAEYGLVTDTRALQEDEPGTTLNSYAQFQMKIPDDIPVSPADATMLITLKETAGFVMNVKVALNESVVILGTGAVGMSMCLFAKLAGAYPVIAIGRRDEALERMKKSGANFLINNQKEEPAQKVKEYTDGKRVELVIDTAGDEKLLNESVNFLSNTGKLTVYAAHSTGNPTEKLDPARVIQGSTGEVATHNYILDLVRLNLMPLKDFYSHRMPFCEIVKGFEMLKNKSAFKIVFEMGGK